MEHHLRHVAELRDRERERGVGETHFENQGPQIALCVLSIWKERPYLPHFPACHPGTGASPRDRRTHLARKARAPTRRDITNSITEASITPNLMVIPREVSRGPYSMQLLRFPYTHLCKALGHDTLLLVRRLSTAAHLHSITSVNKQSTSA